MTGRCATGRRVTALLVAGVTLLAACSSAPGVEVARRDQGSIVVEGAIPVDPDTRIVTLDNGLVVYLRHNDRPGDHAEMRLVIDAGSGVETAEQSGVAHFLEHMLFNGTERFPANELIGVLRNFGMEFGADVNAYTSYDETVYQLSVPLDDASNLGTGLDVLAEWMGAATIAEDEVVAERGVVLDEWRVRSQSSDGRYWAAIEEQYLGVSEYARRSPLGSDNAIKSMTSVPLREFYDTWYRPDNAAVVVVGDIDVDKVEQMVRGRFEAMEPRGGSVPRPQLQLGQFDQAQATAFSDPDVVTTSIALGLPGPSSIAADITDLLDSTALGIAFDVIGNRLADDVSRGAASFASAGVAGFASVRPLAAPGLYVDASGADTEAAIDAALVEVERARRYGFTDREMQRVLTQYRTELDSLVASADTVGDGDYADQAVGHFLVGTAMPPSEWLRDALLPMYDSIETADVERAFEAWLAASAPHLLVTVPLDVDVPTEEELLAAIDALPGRDDITPRADNEDVGDALMTAPEPVEETEREPHLTRPEFLLDSERLEFANGLVLILNSTDITSERVVIDAMSPGGLSAVDDASLWAARYSTLVATQSGVGELDAVELDTVLGSADFAIEPYLTANHEGIYGDAATADLELVMQLIHLYFTAPRFSQTALDSVLDTDRPYIADPLSDPDFASYDAFVRARYGGDERYLLVPTAAQVDAVTLASVERAFRDRFSNVSDWVFVLSGDFDSDEVVDLARRYLGTLVGDGGKDDLGPGAPSMPAGITDVTVKSGTGDTASLSLYFSVAADGSRYESVYADLLTQVVTNRLTTHIREELGASYSPYAATYLPRPPDLLVETYVFVSGAPADMERLADVLRADLRELTTTGPSDEEMAAALAAVQEDYRLFSNEQLADLLVTAIPDEEKLALYEGRDAAAGEISADELAAFAARVLPRDQFVQVVQLPR